jgi:hypothetical protein
VPGTGGAQVRGEQTFSFFCSAGSSPPFRKVKAAAFFPPSYFFTSVLTSTASHPALLPRPAGSPRTSRRKGGKMGCGDHRNAIRQSHPHSLSTRDRYPEPGPCFPGWRPKEEEEEALRREPCRGLGGAAPSQPAGPQLLWLRPASARQAPPTPRSDPAPLRSDPRL